MEKPRLITSARTAREGVVGTVESNEGTHEGPIRKQTLEDRRRYMREYMRTYRRAHPGLSTPYVRKFRAKLREDK